MRIMTQYAEWIFMIFLPIGAILLVLHTIEYLMDIYALKEDPVKESGGKEAIGVKRSAAERISDGYIIMMLLVFPLFFGFSGYAEITLSKFVFFVAAGKTVPHGAAIDVKIVDTPAIIARALGVPAPDNWQAHVPDGLFE